MTLTDGLFQRVFVEVAAEYPEIQSDHQIIDIGAARVAAQPEDFDVIVTMNLHADILSDIAGRIAGSIGLAGSAHVGETAAMFEAVHGSAPDIAGKGIANPSGLLLAAVQMLVHLGQADVAETVKNAWLCTLESGIHTADMYRHGLSRCRVGTDAFAAAVVERLGERPQQLAPVEYRPGGISVRTAEPARADKTLVGVDVFLDWNDAGRDANTLGHRLDAAVPSTWRLEMITNRGVKMYPDGIPDTYRTDHWRCRFVPTDTDPLTFNRVLVLLQRLHQQGFEIIHTEHLYTLSGEPRFSLCQGE